MTIRVERDGSCLSLRLLRESDGRLIYGSFGANEGSRNMAPRAQVWTRRYEDGIARRIETSGDGVWQTTGDGVRASGLSPTARQHQQHVDTLVNSQPTEAWQRRCRHCDGVMTLTQRARPANEAMFVGSDIWTCSQCNRVEDADEWISGFAMDDDGRYSFNTTCAAGHEIAPRFTLDEWRQHVDAGMVQFPCIRCGVSRPATADELSEIARHVR